MRTLKIEKSGKILIDGELVDMGQMSSKSEFITSILMFDVELSEDVSVFDMIHFFYESKELIQSLFSEQYEVVRALVTSSNLHSSYKSLRVYKSFKIENDEDEQEFIYMIPEIEIIKSNFDENGVKLISGLPLIIDENVFFSHNEVIINSRTKITLLDLMTCLFDELPALIKEGVILVQ